MSASPSENSEPPTNDVEIHLDKIVEAFKIAYDQGMELDANSYLRSAQQLEEQGLFNPILEIIHRRTDAGKPVAEVVGRFLQKAQKLFEEKSAWCCISLNSYEKRAVRRGLSLASYKNDELCVPFESKAFAEAVDRQITEEDATNALVPK